MVTHNIGIRISEQIGRWEQSAGRVNLFFGDQHPWTGVELSIEGEVLNLSVGSPMVSTVPMLFTRCEALPEDRQVRAEQLRGAWSGTLHDGSGATAVQLTLEGDGPFELVMAGEVVDRGIWRGGGGILSLESTGPPRVYGYNWYAPGCMSLPTNGVMLPLTKAGATVVPLATLSLPPALQSGLAALMMQPGRSASDLPVEDCIRWIIHARQQVGMSHPLVAANACVILKLVEQAFGRERVREILEELEGAATGWSEQDRNGLRLVRAEILIGEGRFAAARELLEAILVAPGRAEQQALTRLLRILDATESPGEVGLELELRERLVQVVTSFAGSENVNLLPCLAAVADLAAKRGDSATVSRLLARMKGIWERSYGPGSWIERGALQWLAGTLEAHSAEARAVALGINQEMLHVTEASAIVDTLELVDVLERAWRLAKRIGDPSADSLWSALTTKLVDAGYDNHHVLSWLELEGLGLEALTAARLKPSLEWMEKHDRVREELRRRVEPAGDYAWGFAWAYPFGKGSLARWAGESPSLSPQFLKSVLWDTTRLLAAEHRSVSLRNTAGDAAAALEWGLVAKSWASWRYALDPLVSAADRPGVAKESLAWVGNFKALYSRREARIRGRNALAHTNPLLGETISALQEVEAEMAALLESARSGSTCLAEDLWAPVLMKRHQVLEERAKQGGMPHHESSRWVGSESLVKCVPKDGVHVEWLVHWPRDMTQEVTSPEFWQSPVLYAWVVRGGDSSVDLVVFRDFEPIQALIQKAAGAGWPAPALEELHRVLWEPLGVDSESGRLTIAPDDVLWLVPWAAVGPAAKPLVLQHDLAMVGSSKDLLRSMRGQPPTGASVVVHSPEFSVPDGSPWRTRFASLPAAEREGEAALRVLVDASVEVVPLTGPDATKAAVLGLRRPEELVIATHGVFVAAGAGDVAGFGMRATGPEPEYSDGQGTMGLLGLERQDSIGAQGIPAIDRAALVLSATPGEGAWRDPRLLTAGEILGMDLRGTRLVVLSCCKGALGDIVSGQGMRSLQDACYRAGSAFVVGAMQNVPDEATAELMGYFYEHYTLSSKMPVSSLANAQRDYLKAHPDAPASHWAYFQVYGRPHIP